MRAATVIALAFATLPTPGVAAAQGKLAWSTYLRSGPGQTYRALDELEHGTPVTVAACSGRWCRISADGLEGFIDREALDLPRLPTPGSAASPACVVAGQTDARAPKPTRFCGPSTAQKTAPPT